MLASFQSTSRPNDEKDSRTAPEVAIRRRRTSSAEAPDDGESVSPADIQRRKSTRVSEHDHFQYFGNYVASELRRIPNPETANIVQRKVARFLLDCLDVIDATDSRGSELTASMQWDPHDIKNEDPLSD